MTTIAQLKDAPHFVDYSHWQGHVNGDKLKNYGIRGAIVKAGEVWMQQSGQPAKQDDMHDWNVGEIKRANLLLGNYYFWHPKAGASKQYNHYWEISQEFDFDFPPIIDVEQFDGYTYADKAEVSRQLQAMVDGVTRLFGRNPIIYTTQALWISQIGDPEWANDLYLWFAQYNSTMTPIPANLVNRVIMWQYTDKLAIPGLVTLDANYWLKSEQDLVDLLRHDTTTPTPITYTKIEITCNFLRGRSRPIYTDATKKVIFENGQILNLVQPVQVIVESDVPWVEVMIPEAECTCWVSSNPNYTRMII